MPTDRATTSYAHRAGLSASLRLTREQESLVLEPYLAALTCAGPCRKARDVRAGVTSPHLAGLREPFALLASGRPVAALLPALLDMKRAEIALIEVRAGLAAPSSLRALNVSETRAQGAFDLAQHEMGERPSLGELHAALARVRTQVDASLAYERELERRIAEYERSGAPSGRAA